MKPKWQKFLLSPCGGSCLTLAAYLLYWCVSWRVRGWPPVSRSVKDLLVATVSVSAIAVGFLGTAKSILISMGNRKIVKQLKDAGYYGQVIDYLMAAINLAFALAIGSAAALLLDIGLLPPHCYVVVFGLWLLLAAWTAFTCYRVIRVFAKILRAEQE